MPDLPPGGVFGRYRMSFPFYQIPSLARAGIRVRAHGGWSLWDKNSFSTVLS
jgi:hypothetical protein